MENPHRSSRDQKEERMRTRRSRPVPLLFLSVLLGAASLFAWLWLVLFPFCFFSPIIWLPCTGRLCW